MPSSRRCACSAAPTKRIGWSRMQGRSPEREALGPAIWSLYEPRLTATELPPESAVDLPRFRRIIAHPLALCLRPTVPDFQRLNSWHIDHEVAVVFPVIYVHSVPLCCNAWNHGTQVDWKLGLTDLSPFPSSESLLFLLLILLMACYQCLAILLHVVITLLFRNSLLNMLHQSTVTTLLHWYMSPKVSKVQFRGSYLSPVLQEIDLVESVLRSISVGEVHRVPSHLCASLPLPFASLFYFSSVTSSASPFLPWSITDGGVFFCPWLTNARFLVYYWKLSPTAFVLYLIFVSLFKCKIRRRFCTAVCIVLHHPVPMFSILKSALVLMLWLFPFPNSQFCLVDIRTSISLTVKLAIAVFSTLKGICFQHVFLSSGFGYPKRDCFCLLYCVIVINFYMSGWPLFVNMKQISEILLQSRVFFKRFI